MKSIYTITAVLLCLIASQAVTAAQVNIYSGRGEQLIKPLLDKFGKQTGIQVNLVTAKDDALIKKLELEGSNSPADILITADAGRLYRAKQAGLLQPIESRILTNDIPVHMRDPENYWFGVTIRARPIMYRKGKINPNELTTYEALANKKWKGQICIRSSSNIYNQSLVASMISAMGVSKTESWAKSFVANFARKPQGGDRDQIKAVAAGVCNIAIANTYYLAGMLQGKDPAQKEAAKKVAVFWPNQKERGTHINISGMGVTKAAKNKSEAIRLLEFMLSQEAQTWYAETNGEYPVLEQAQVSPVLKGWGKYKRDDLNLSLLGAYNAEAVKVMDRAGWR